MQGKCMMQNKNQEHQLTTIDQSWVANYKWKCPCYRRNTPSYFCDDDKCQNYDQQFYCMECIIEDRKHTSHDSIKIQVILEQISSQWKIMIEKYNKLLESIEEPSKKILSLLKYLDQEDKLEINRNQPSPYHNVSDDITQLKNQYASLVNYMEKAEQNFTQNNLIKLIELAPKLKEFNEFFEGIMYLQNLANVNEHQQFILDIYQPTLRFAASSSQPFTDLTKENQEMLLRLKFYILSSQPVQEPQNINNNLSRSQISAEEEKNFRIQIKNQSRLISDQHNQIQNLTAEIQFQQQQKIVISQNIDQQNNSIQIMKQKLNQIEKLFGTLSIDQINQQYLNLDSRLKQIEARESSTTINDNVNTQIAKLAQEINKLKNDFKSEDRFQKYQVSFDQKFEDLNNKQLSLNQTVTNLNLQFVHTFKEKQQQSIQKQSLKTGISRTNGLNQTQRKQNNSSYSSLIPSKDPEMQENNQLLNNNPFGRDKN